MLNHEQYYYKTIHEMKAYSILYLNIYIVIIYDIELSYGEAMNHVPSLSKLSLIFLSVVSHFVPT